jgi:hypothetical protein
MSLHLDGVSLLGASIRHLLNRGRLAKGHPTTSSRIPAAVEDASDEIGHEADHSSREDHTVENSVLLLAPENNEVPRTVVTTHFWEVFDHNLFTDQKELMCFQMEVMLCVVNALYNLF